MITWALVVFIATMMTSRYGRHELGADALARTQLGDSRSTSDKGRSRHPGGRPKRARSTSVIGRVTRSVATSAS